MVKVCTCYGCCTKQYFTESGNGQDIREILLREAVKYSQCYSTDIIIWIERAAKELYENGKDSTDCYIGDNGVAWEGKEYNNIRKAFRLIKENDTLTLFDISKPIMDSNIKKLIDKTLATAKSLDTEKSEDILKMKYEAILHNLMTLEKYIL